MKTVLIFGSFDGLHEGHRHLIRTARQLGDRLVVALATDAVIIALKHRAPDQPFDERQSALHMLEQVDEVVMGDEELGNYTIIGKVQPNVVAFGYDQDALQQDFQRHAELNQLSIQVETISPHHPEIYKSSLLRVPRQSEIVFGTMELVIDAGEANDISRSIAKAGHFSK